MEVSWKVVVCGGNADGQVCGGCSSCRESDFLFCLSTVALSGTFSFFTLLIIILMERAVDLPYKNKCSVVRDF